MSKPTKTDTTPAPVAAKPAGVTMLDMFKPVEGEVDNSAKLERRNLPPIIKLEQVPIGSAVQGTILKVVDSPTTETSGKLLWLSYKGTEFTFPAIGTIRSALAPGLKDDAKIEAKLKTEIGNYFYAKRLPNKPSKKTLMVFEVRVGKI